MMFNMEHITAIWDSMYVSFGIVMFVAAFVFTVLMMWWKRLLAPFLIAFVGLPTIVFYDVIPTYLTFERLCRELGGYRIYESVDESIRSVAAVGDDSSFCDLNCLITLLNTNVEFYEKVDSINDKNEWDLSSKPPENITGSRFSLANSDNNACVSYKDVGSAELANAISEIEHRNLELTK